MITFKKSEYKDLCVFFKDEEMYDRMSDDSCPSLVDFVPPKEGYESLSAFVDGKLASLFIVFEKSGLMHFGVLKSFRKYSRKFIKIFLEMYKDPIVCEIPEKYAEVINFAKKSGFKEIGYTGNYSIKNANKYKMMRLIWVV